MPYTKLIILAAWLGVGKLCRYLQNQAHPNHAEYTIEPMKLAHPAVTPGNFLEVVKAAFQKMAGQNRRGRPVKNLMSLHICRTPDGTWLDEKERERHILSRCG